MALKVSTAECQSSDETVQCRGVSERTPQKSHLQIESLHTYISSVVLSRPSVSNTHEMRSPESKKQKGV